MIRALVCDLYDTLLYLNQRDSLWMRFDGLQSRYLADRHLVLTRSLDTDELARLLKVDAISFRQAIQEEINSARLFADTVPTLRRLKMSALQIGLVSNLAEPYIRPYYDLGLDSMIDAPVFSCRAGYMKPQPEIYQIALTRLGVCPDEALFVGNSLRNDVEGPKSLGMKALMLKRNDSDNLRDVDCIHSLSEITERLGIVLEDN